MVNHCRQNLCARDEDVTKKYAATSWIIYIPRNSMYVKIYVHVVYEICEMQAHEVYEMYNKNRIFLQC
jgi:hypothetical protein